MQTSQVDAIQHQPWRDGKRLVDNLRAANASYLAATSFGECAGSGCGVGHEGGKDLRLGDTYGNDLTKPPFSLGAPIDTCMDDSWARNKFVGLWKL